jgi:squalene-hopene/tetraprenyl-beta-curcumene cyclase
MFEIAPAPTPTADVDLARGIARAVDHLLSLQFPDGYWWGELEANVTMAAEHLLLEHFLGIGDDRRWRKISAYLLERQLPDGSWPIYFGGSGDVSITTEAYFALKLAGADPSSPQMAGAREFVRSHGGIGATRIFTKLWLALFGQFEWNAFPAMPPEAILLPTRFPLNVYAFASWARATIVPILVVWAHRPVVPLPDGAGVSELYVDPRDGVRIRYKRDPSPVSWRNAFRALDRLLRLHERAPWKPLRARALAACERWIIDHQEADGSWGGIQPPWVYSLIALRCLGYANDHPVMARGIRGLVTSFAIETETTWTVQPCLSPVWDTALAVIGLREAGVAADHPALRRSGEWLLEREVRSRGDWCVNVKGVEPGGWAFEFANEKYPDTDDTAEVLMALRLLDLGDRERDAVRRAERWLRAMQSRNGGWGAFDRDNTRAFVTKIPFADFGATTDPPSEDATAHIVEMFALSGAASDRPMTRQAIDYLLRAQERDGSWFGRWGVSYTYGLGAVLPALAAAGVDPRGLRIRRAARWLVERQNGDGGWGEACASYESASLRGRGASTASQTSWALLALMAAGEERSAAVRRGIAYLLTTQRREGGWDEPEFTGTGFPRDFMLNYHLYRDYWPLWALGRYRRLLSGRPVHLPGTDPLS